MKISTKKTLAIVRSSHPIPCLAVSLFAGMFSLGAGLTFERSLVIYFAVLLQQISVGLSNDWIDFKRDKAAGRIDKPTVSGLVKLSELKFWSLTALVLALIVAGFLGGRSFALMVLMLAVGWGYNLGLKLNWASAIPYAIGFGSIPIFVGASAPIAFEAKTWVIAAAALLGISAHFANVLPDMIDDKLTGVKALPHILGQRASSVIIACTAFIATLLVVTQSNNLAPAVSVIGVILTILLVGTASLLSLRSKPPRIVFPLLIAASFVNVLLLMLGAGN